MRDTEKISASHTNKDFASDTVAVVLVVIMLEFLIVPV